MSNDKLVTAKERFKTIIEVGLSAKNDSSRGPWSHADFDELVMLYTFLKSDLPIKIRDILADGYNFDGRSQLSAATRIERAISVYETYGIIDISDQATALEPTFSLPESEKERVLTLTSQMRKIIFSSTIFDEAHRVRLLDRISAVETEINKPKGRLDVILAGVSDLGDTLKKFGTDLKPLTDRYSEVRKITQSKSPEYAQIPAPEEQKQLPAPENNDEE